MKNKKMLIILLLVVVIVFITAGATYAFLSYTKEGLNENSIRSGSITFHYDESSDRSVSLIDAIPMPDSVGKTQSYFEFTITSKTATHSIPYQITARKEGNAATRLDDDDIRIYLTKVNSNNEEVSPEILLDNYDELPNVTYNGVNEQLLYVGSVPANTSNYSQKYRLRLWIDSDVSFSGVENPTTHQLEYPKNNKTFVVKVNVYSGDAMQEVTVPEITSLTTSTQDVVITPVENEDYDYETEMPYGTESTTLNIQTESPNDTVIVENVTDSFAYVENSNIRRLSTTQQKTLSNLQEGDNYFKITIKSQTKVRNSYVLKLTVQSVIEISSKVMGDNQLQQGELTKTQLNTVEASDNTNKIFVSTATNDGSPTYYFRGKVDNNNVKFKDDPNDYTWRIIRINEDGSVRLILDGTGINNGSTYYFNKNNNKGATNMYFSSSNVVDGAMNSLDTWYNGVSSFYDNYVINGDFCEEAKVTGSSAASNYNIGVPSTIKSIDYYTANFMCVNDRILARKVGLITYDEVVYAGSGVGPSHNNIYYYLYTGGTYWTMSPGAVDTSGYADIWYVNSGSYLQLDRVSNRFRLRPVINISGDTLITGSGTSQDPYIVQ